jgi:hypothetical protein
MQMAQEGGRHSSRNTISFFYGRSSYPCQRSPFAFGWDSKFPFSCVQDLLYRLVEIAKYFFSTPSLQRQARFPVIEA